jgi:hypothetical protein
MLHITSIEDGEASWQVRGQHPEMESFTDYRSTAPAFRMRLDGSTVAIPNGTPGVVYFGEGDARPDLALVREWFPQHWKLWDAVRAAYWDAVVPLAHSRCRALSEAAYDYVAPTDGRILLERADASVCEVGEDGWPIDYDSLDMADPVDLEPTDRMN